jgi:hypothetical protein
LSDRDALYTLRPRPLYERAEIRNDPLVLDAQLVEEPQERYDLSCNRDEQRANHKQPPTSFSANPQFL